MASIFFLKSFCLALFAPKEHWKLASHEVAGKSASKNSSRKGRWKTSAQFRRAFRHEINLFVPTSHFVAG
jgi:hypothetical protein